MGAAFWCPSKHDKAEYLWLTFLAEDIPDVTYSI
jgi:hypothetical protein